MGNSDTSANRARRSERVEIDALTAQSLDDAAREYTAARALAIQALRRLVLSAIAVGVAVTKARPNIRGPFAKWCLQHCRVFHPAKMRGVCAMAGRTHLAGLAETWQLRMLGVVQTVHHSVRPEAQKRVVKPMSFISHVTRTREGVAKLIEQKGGIQNLTTEEKGVIERQLGSLDDVRRQLSHGR